MIVKKEKTEALADAAERAQMQGSSLWDDAWRRFRKNRAAVYSVTILVLITLFVIFAPMLTHYAYDFNDWDALSAPPSARHFLGTDSLGRDLLSRAAVGGRISLLVGLSGALVAVVIGTLYGALAGFFGGKIDSLMMRFLEILNAFPFMLFVILLTTFFGRSLILIFAAVGLVSWLDVARIVRGQTLSLKHKEFVEAARVSGMSRRRIVVRHIIPNVLGVVMVYASCTNPSSASWGWACRSRWPAGARCCRKGRSPSRRPPGSCWCPPSSWWQRCSASTSWVTVCATRWTRKTADAGIHDHERKHERHGRHDRNEWNERGGHER